MSATTYDAARAPISTTLAAFAVLIGLTAARLLLAAHLELHFDEAYYWYWSKNLQASYYDHPPAVAWFIRAGTALFGDTELGVRVFGQVSMIAATCLVFDAARRLFSSQAALIAAAGTQATLLFGAGSIVMTPDTPLVLFATIGLWALIRFTLSGNGRWWLVVGAAGGAALLSKYTAGLLMAAVGIWLVATPQLRRWLSTPWPWLCAVAAVICFSPVLVWNAGHGWVSFAKQGGRLIRWDAVRPGLAFEYLGSQMGLITPGLFVLLLAAVWIVARRAIRSGAPLDTLLALWFLVPAGFFLAVSPLLRVQGNWLAPAWPAAFIALASLFARNRGLPRLRSAVFWAEGTGAALVALVWLYALVPFGPAFKGNPLALLNGQRAFAAEIADFARRNDSSQLIAADYATASMLRFYVPPGLAVTHVADKPRYIGFSPQPLTMPAVVVTRGPWPLPSRIAQRFSFSAPGVLAWRTYRGQPYASYILSVATKVRP